MLHLERKGGMKKNWEERASDCDADLTIFALKQKLESKDFLLQESCAVRKWPTLSLCAVYIHSGLLGEKHGFDGKLQQILKLQQLEGKIFIKGKLSGALPGLPQANIYHAWACFSINA